ncbi:MAG: hypothetical protein JWQ89_1828 [Devosia sp.]|uniref:DUF2628 domain-containing protein n=1 Tax=Devosia sp. TaxID=1871048 RepID=UPI002618300F|nr:DUF2628 domain-containing protein [Devosia sp.]MDB5540101.1 hypothetical protein [Devosia sp.]
MTLYSVYERQSDAPAAVADRFSWSAAVLPPVHALVHGLWLLLALWVIGTLAIVAVGLWMGSDAAFWLYVLFAALIGFEAASFRRVRTARRGGRYRGEIVATAEDLALVDYLKRQPQ